MTSFLRHTSAPLIGTLLLLSITLAAARLSEHRETTPLEHPLDTLSTQIAGFAGTTNPPIPENVLKELKPTSYLVRTYRKPELQADLFIAFYAQQRAGENMHSPKHCLPGSGWEIWDYGTEDIPAQGRSFTVNRYSISHEGERRIVLYWYQSGRRIFASEYLGKLLLARDALLQNSTAASIVRIIVPDRPDALHKIVPFASELIPQIEHCFGN